MERKNQHRNSLKAYLEQRPNFSMLWIVSVLHNCSPEEFYEFLQNNQHLEFENPMAPLEQWKREAKAWIEIMRARREGRIEFRLRHGWQIFNRQQIESLSERYDIPKEKIIFWLGGKSTPHLIMRMGRERARLGKENNKEINIQEVHRLYFDERLSMLEVGRKLGFKSYGPIQRVFREQGWVTRRKAAKKQNYNVKEIYRLYYIEGLTKEEVAKELGTHEWSLRKVFKEQGWKSRIRKFETDEERALARKDTVKKRLKRIKNLRDEIFGAECRICGKTRDLAIHKKDGIEHERDFLWRKGNLESANPDEWVVLCISCHRGTHWMMETYGYEWDDIESQMEKPMNIESLDALRIPGDDTPSSREYLELRENFEGETEDLRRALFGETCYYCGVHYKEKKVSIHRKDGRSHEEKLTKREKYFRTLDPTEWVALCSEHHRHVHWAMDALNLDWSDLERSS